MHIPGLEQGIDALYERGTHPKHAETHDGLSHLRMPRSYTIIGVLSLLLFVPYPIMLFLHPEKLLFQIILTVAMAVLFGGIGTMCLLYGLHHRVIIADEHFHVVSAFGKEQMVRWTDVRKGRYSSIERVMVLTTVQGERIRVSAYLRGAKLFWRTLNSKGGTPVGDWGLPYFYWY